MKEAKNYSGIMGNEINDPRPFISHIKFAYGGHFSAISEEQEIKKLYPFYSFPSHDHK